MNISQMTVLKHVRNVKFFFCAKTKFIYQYTVSKGLERWSTTKYANANIAKSYLP